MRDEGFGHRPRGPGATQGCRQQEGPSWRPEGARLAPLQSRGGCVSLAQELCPHAGGGPVEEEAHQWGPWAQDAAGGWGTAGRAPQLSGPGARCGREPSAAKEQPVSTARFRSLRNARSCSLLWLFPRPRRWVPGSAPALLPLVLPRNRKGPTQRWAQAEDSGARQQSQDRAPLKQGLERRN